MTPNPIVPEGEKPFPGITRRTVDWRWAIARLEEIHADLQHPDRFHDQWDWMDAAFAVEVLKATLEPTSPQQPESVSPEIEPEVCPQCGFAKYDAASCPNAYHPRQAAELEEEVADRGLEIQHWKAEAAAFRQTAHTLQQEVAALDAKLRAALARNQVLEKALNSPKLPKMFVWPGRGKWVAMAHAFSVAEARELMIEEVGGTDGSCPVRTEALEQIRNGNPTIFYSANAEFALTDSGELEEADAHSKTLEDKLKSAESKLARLLQPIEKEPPVCITDHNPPFYLVEDAKPIFDSLTAQLNAAKENADAE